MKSQAENTDTNQEEHVSEHTKNSVPALDLQLLLFTSVFDRCSYFQIYELAQIG